MLSEINSVYYVMRLIRHRATLLDHVPIDAYLMEASRSERKIILKIIEEIETVEGVAIQRLDEERANANLLSLSNRIVELTKHELVEHELDLTRGDELLNKLRSGSEYAVQDTTPAFKHGLVNSRRTQFRIGQTVVYPNHGLGIIEQIEQKQIGAVQLPFYVLRLFATNSPTLVPVSNAAEVGLRLPVSADQANGLLANLSKGFSAGSIDPRERFKQFSDKMRTGNISEVADVLRYLAYLSSQKPLSFREQRMLERARYLVISEVASATGQPEPSVERSIDEALVSAFAQHDKPRRIVNSKWQFRS